MNKSLKILNILMYLSSHPYGVYFEELQNEFELTERSLLRYINLIEDAGLELIREREGKFYKYSLNKTILSEFFGGLTDDDRDTIAIFTPFMKLFSDTSFYKRAEVLFDKLQINTEDSIIKYFPGPLYKNTEYGDYLNIIYAAIKQKKELEIYYSSKQNIKQIKTYLIKPMNIVLYQNGIYFFGLKKGIKNDYRIWSISRLSKASISDTSFKIDPDFSFDSHFENTFGIFQGSTTNKIKIRIYEDALKEFKKMNLHSSAKIKYPTKNTMELELDVIGFEDVKSFFLKFANSVEIISPQALRDEMKETLIKTLKLYQ